MTTTARKGKSSGSTVAGVADRIERIERLLNERMRAVMRVKDLACYLGKTEGTVRTLLSSSNLPRHFDANGHVFFLRRELEKWLYFDDGTVQDKYMFKHGHIGYRWLTQREGEYQASIWSLMKAVKHFCSLYSDERSPNMPRPMAWRHAKDIVAEYEADGIRALDRYCDEIDTLIIDDLGTEDREAKNYGSQRNVMEEILSRRYDRGKMTMVTTNIDFEQVKAFYRSRVYDRIRETFNIIAFMGGSHRKKFNPNI